MTIIAKTAGTLEHVMKSGRKCLFICAALPVVALVAALPARADFCLQLNGTAFSGDLGFFRFHGNMPADPGKIVTLKGRVAGLSPVFGTATVAKDGTYVELGATFFADAEQGQIDVTFFPPDSKRGSGYGNYGQYGTGTSFDASVVSCSLEP